MTDERIRAITQSMIAVLVIAGSGLAIFLRPGQDNSALVGVAGSIVGWYFRGATSTALVNQITHALSAQAQAQSLTGK